MIHDCTHQSSNVLFPTLLSSCSTSLCGKGRTLKSIWGSIVIPSATSFTRVAFVLNLVFVLNFPSIFFEDNSSWQTWWQMNLLVQKFLHFWYCTTFSRQSAGTKLIQCTAFWCIFHFVRWSISRCFVTSWSSSSCGSFVCSIAECGLPSLFWISLAIRLDLMKRIAIMGDGSTLFLPEWPRISTHVKKVTVVGVYAILKYVLIASFLSTWFSHVCFVQFLFFKEVGIKHKKQLSPLNSKWQFGQHWPTAPMSRNPILQQLWRNAQRHPQLHANARDVHRKLS